MNAHLEKNFVIHIEDSKFDAFLFSTLLKKMDFSFEILHLKDGEEALNFILNCGEEGSDMVDGLLILDLTLPKISGYEILEKLKETKYRNRLRVVVFSESENPEDQIRCQLLGANNYFVKPFTLEEYRSLLNGPFLEELQYICPNLKQPAFKSRVLPS